LVSETRAPLK